MVFELVGDLDVDLDGDGDLDGDAQALTPVILRLLPAAARLASMLAGASRTKKRGEHG